MMLICGKIVALADGEIVRVMRGRDFDCAGAEFGIRPIVSNDGHFAIDQRHANDV